MSPAPPALSELYFWRPPPNSAPIPLNQVAACSERSSRWNSKGVKAVYGSVDPSTAILEVAVHKGFRALDCVPHVLTAARILAPSRVPRIVPSQIANPNWLIPGTPSLGQQKFGDELLERHPFILIPSTVSRHSWNIVMNPQLAQGLYEVVRQERFALDTRLNPPPH